jgi:hypothetical protein
VSSVRYEYHLYIKSKVIPITGPAGLYGFSVRYERGKETTRKTET